MLRRTLTEESTAPSQSYTPQYIPVPRKDEMSEAHVEDYLDHFCVPLVGKVSYEERVKMREELRTQIESVIAAHVELGSTREEAIPLVLRQFSHVPAVEPAPHTVPRQVHPQQVHRQTVEAFHVAPPARPKGAFLSFSLFGLATFLQILTASSLEHGGSSSGLFALLMMAAYPLLAGLALGYRRPDRPLRTMARSFAWLALPTLAMSSIVFNERSGWAEAGCIMTAVLLGGNLLFGGIGAKLGIGMRRSGFLDKIDPPYPARVDNGPYRLP